MDSTIKALHKNIAEWMAGPTGAVVLHLMLILALLFLVDFSTTKDDPTIEVNYVEAVTAPFDPPPPPLVKLTASDLPPDVTPPEVDISAEITPPETPDFSQPAPTVDLAVLDIELNVSPVIIRGLTPSSMEGRVGEENRAQAGKRHGGEWAAYAEVSVLRALEWLRVNQNSDGSWGTNDKEAMTGLALLTYLAHGETSSSEKYGETVTRAIQLLIARQNEEGEFAKTDTTAGTYSQAICVYAVSEAYGMTRIPAFKPVMEKGAHVLIQGQQANGGFDYRFQKGARRDTSLGGWCSQALKAAFIAGAENPGLKTAMELAVADMKSAQKNDGSFMYSNSESHSTSAMTAVAVLSMQLLGHGRENPVKDGLAYLRDANCDWKNPPDWPLYAWYYISQTKFHQGGGSWTSWNNQFAPQFIRNQNEDGSWNSPGLSLKAGSTGRENMHPVYATTLAALTLQVYYRFLPTYQPIEEQAVDQKSDSDVLIQIL